MCAPHSEVEVFVNALCQCMLEAWGVSRAAKALILKTSGEKHTKTCWNPHLSSWQRVRISSAAICEAATAPPAANVGEISINPALAQVAAP